MRAVGILVMAAGCADGGVVPLGKGEAPAEASCVGSGLSDAATAWALPPGYADGAFEQLPDVDSVDPAWALLDLDGDGAVELVVSGDASDAALGTSEWRVHAPEGDGFAATPTTWALPEGYAEGSFATTTGRVGELAWGLYDLDADGLLDLVVTADVAAPDVGASVWHLHRNTGSGFASEPEAWALPAADFPAGSFGALSDMRVADPGWTLADLDGDGAADLVVTFTPGSDLEVGWSYWAVHRNTGSGFDATPTLWSLPAAPAGTFVAVPDAEEAAPAWALVDMDGDGAPEIVFTEIAEDADVGVVHWSYHPNTGAGFAETAVEWALPSGFVEGTFARAWDPATGTPNWTLADMDRDGPPDILVTENSTVDAAVGTSTWEVWRGSAAGVSGAATTWYLPEGFAARQFALPYDPSPTAPNWTLTDLDGPSAWDLVVTSDDAGGALGTSEWHVYRGTCE